MAPLALGLRKRSSSRGGGASPGNLELPPYYSAASIATTAALSASSPSGTRGGSPGGGSCSFLSSSCGSFNEDSGGRLTVATGSLTPSHRSRGASSRLGRLFHSPVVSEETTSSFLFYGELHPCDQDGVECPDNVEESEVYATFESFSGRSRSSLDSAQLPKAAVLGRGQYGIVWRAKSQRTGGLVAVKCIDLEMEVDEEEVDRETRAAISIRDNPHPCLVRLFKVFTLDGDRLGALVMEFCQGGNLQNHIKLARMKAKEKRGDYSPPELARQWAAQIFSGLAHLHLKVKLLLRDLKPANVMIGDGNCAKLTDFGLSRVGVRATGKSFAFPAGTPGFVAPEVGKSMPYSHKADVYSYGVLLWVLLTGGFGQGIPPYSQATDQELEEDDCEPCPPYDGGVNDEWELLQPRIQEIPEGVARDFVSLLTHTSEKKRLTHADIREHPFFDEGPDLVERPPRLEAGLEEVEAWVQRLFDHRGAQLRTPLAAQAIAIEEFLHDNKS